MRTTFAGSSPSRSATSTAAPSGSACGRSILFTTGTISSPFSIARYAFASVCASIPWAASTTSSAPSHAWSERETSYVKSTCPGVSIRFSSWPFHATRTACALIVIPRSRSSSIESSICSFMSRAATVSVTSRMRSASVDFPWSMWAMIEKLRILLWSMGPWRWYSSSRFRTALAARGCVRRLREPWGCRGSGRPVRHAAAGGRVAARARGGERRRPLRAEVPRCRPGAEGAGRGGRRRRAGPRARASRCRSSRWSSSTRRSARDEPDPEIQDLLEASVGLNLGVDYLPGALPFSPAGGAASPTRASPPRSSGSTPS